MATLSSYLKNTIIEVFKTVINQQFEYHEITNFIETYKNIIQIIIKMDFSSLDIRINKELNYIISNNNNSLEYLCKYIHYTIINSDDITNIKIINNMINHSTNTTQTNFIEIYNKYLTKRTSSQYFNEEKEKSIVNNLKDINFPYKSIYVLIKIIDDVVNSKANMTHYKNIEFIKTDNVSNYFDRNNFNNFHQIKQGIKQ